MAKQQDRREFLKRGAPPGGGAAGALDLGTNYIDPAARYGGDTPWSQTYIGQVMKRRRGEAFLATKTHDRTRDGSLKLLEQSLKLLQTDHLPRRPPRASQPRALRHDPPGPQRGRPAPPELPAEAAAARGGEGDGDHRQED